MDYPYTQEWKDSVDKLSQDWLHYCECVDLCKQFLKTIKTQGKKKADANLLSFVSMVVKHRGADAADRLRNDFKRVFKNERAMLEAAIH